MANMGQWSQRNRSVEQIPERIRLSLVELLEATEYAEQTSGDFWEFAVEMERLAVYGLTLNDFRWLVRQSLVEHRREITLESNDGRAFRRTGDLTFPDRTCFVLTDYGVSVVRALRAGFAPQGTAGMSVVYFANRDTIEANISHHGSTNAVSAPTEIPLPKWDSERRLLSVGGMTVKQFRWAAENQEAVLSVFEEEGWPPRIEDPLSPHPNQNPKRRLSDTIKCLNRKQSNPMIHFRGDGTGEGVVWDFTPKPASKNGADR